MAYYKITKNKDGILQAKIQAYGKDITTGEKKIYAKRVYNTEGLTEAKFRKYVEKESNLFEEKLEEAYQQQEIVREKILTFDELFQEWKKSILTNLSMSYYHRVLELENHFSEFLKKNGLFYKPINEIKVRDIQLFLDSFTTKTYKLGQKSTAVLKKTLPKTVNFRELDREEIIKRWTSYYMNHTKKPIDVEKAKDICSKYKLNFDEYFEMRPNEKHYSPETIKGYRRMLRTVFNEAVRYDWISKNPVSRTKIGGGNANISINEISEKAVFSFAEVKQFLKVLDDLPEEHINYRVCLKIMLLTGVRNAELHGLRWSDIDLENRIIHVRRNRLYSNVTKTVYEKCPKTKTSVRDIPLPNELYKELVKYKEWFREADKDFDNKLDRYYLASNSQREPLYPHAIGHYLTLLEQNNGLKHVSPHGLRHTYCSLLLAQNVPIQTVTKYMGHSDSTITLQVYTHFIPDTQEKVIAALDNLTEK